MATLTVLFAACLVGALTLLALGRERRTRERVLRAAGAPPKERPAGDRWPGVLGGRLRRARPAPHEVATALGALAGTLAASLRAGRTLVQSLEAVAASDGSQSWVRAAVGRVLAARSVGAPLDVALSDLAPDGDRGPAELLVTALRVGARTGAGLPGLLDQVAGSLAARAGAYRDLHVQTTQARLSGTVLCLMPLGFFVLAALSSARDVLPVLATRAGATALVAGLALQAAGMWAIRRIVRVEL